MDPMLKLQHLKIWALGPYLVHFQRIVISLASQDILSPIKRMNHLNKEVSLMV